MGSTTVDKNKQTLTGMYLTADAQGGASSKPLESFLEVPGQEADTSTALVKQVRLQLWDTAGAEQFRSVTRIYFRDAVAAIVVFDVTARETLEKCARWVEDLRAEAPENCILCLTGNKIDLEEKREVTAEEMVLFA